MPRASSFCQPREVKRHFWSQEILLLKAFWTRVGFPSTWSVEKDKLSSCWPGPQVKPLQQQKRTPVKPRSVFCHILSLEKPHKIPSGRVSKNLNSADIFGRRALSGGHARSCRYGTENWQAAVSWNILSARARHSDFASGAQTKWSAGLTRDDHRSGSAPSQNIPLMEKWRRGNKCDGYGGPALTDTYQPSACTAPGQGIPQRLGTRARKIWLSMINFSVGRPDFLLHQLRAGRRVGVMLKDGWGGRRQ